jgi:hypothetical protein
VDDENVSRGSKLEISMKTCDADKSILEGVRKAISLLSDVLVALNTEHTIRPTETPAKAGVESVKVDETTVVTHEDLRRELVALSSKVGPQQTVTLLEKHSGFRKASQVPEEKLRGVIQKLQVDVEGATARAF